MANTTITAGATPAPLSLPARLLGIVISPRATFEAVVAHPRWFGALAVTTLLIALGTSVPMMTEAGQQATLDMQVSQMEKFGFKVTDEQYEQMRRRMGYSAYTTAGSVLVATPLVTLIVGGILFAIFNAAMGGDASFKQLFAVLAHASVISALQQLFTGPLNLVQGTMTSKTNLAVLLPMVSDESFLGRLLGAIDLFTIWYCFVLAIGLGVLYRRRTQPIAIGLFIVYAVIAIAIAAVMSQMGGA